MQTEIQTLPQGPSSSPSLVSIVLIVFLVLLVIGLGVWLVLLLAKPKPTCPPQPGPSSTTVPVYIYGFAPGPTAREISSASGVLTPSDNSLRVAPLSQSSPQNQQWRLISQGMNLLLQHVPSSRYVMGSNGSLSFTENPAQATNFTLTGPFRNGRAYYLRSGSSYLTTNADLSVSLTQQPGAIPLNTEWMIALGSCQSTGAGGC